MPYNLPMVRAGWRWWHYIALGLAGLAGLVGIVLLVWRAPPALYAYVPDPKDRAAAEASTRTGLIAGLAGLGALGSLAIATRTYRLTQQGQITDRYTKAIEQLGSDKLDVRLGGIYALERIARDSERDHPTVVEVLSAFVREHSDPAQIIAPNPMISSARSMPPTDIQAALTVLGRLPHRLGVSRGDLAGAFLVGADLTGANLSGARLIGANLSGARLIGANLSGALINRADLSGADLAGANLSDAWLGSTMVSGARFSDLQTLRNPVTNIRNPGGVEVIRLVGLTQEQLDSVVGDAHTQLPNGMKRPDHWTSDKGSEPRSL
jgi:hypothetical protein